MKKRIAWIGETSPSEDYFSIPELIIKENYHRVNPSFHGSFDEIIFVENNLSDFFTWPLIIDEMVRLIDNEGIFSLKVRISSSFFSIVSLNNKLYGLSEGKIHLESFLYEQDNIIIKFKFIRRATNIDNTWSFGIVWDGKNEDFLIKYINSINNQSIKTQYEIIICGPYINLENNMNCHFINADETVEKYSNISSKKNLIVQKALYENICIVHNRYELDKNFIESFNYFGLDFDIVVVSQKLLDGRRVPDWISQSSNFIFTNNYLLNYDDYSPYQYIGGGMMIAKRTTLLKYKWNELLVWNTGEDIEISKRLKDNGIEPRFNKYTSVNVLNLRKGILEDFISLSTIDLLMANYDIYKIKNEKNYIFICFDYFKKLIKKLMN